jgi:hypothetical protein
MAKDKEKKTPPKEKEITKSQYKSGIFIYKDGSIYEGEYSGEGSSIVKQGVGKYSDSVSKAVYNGNWEKDKMSGKGRLDFPSGSYYEGYFTNNSFNGQGTFTWPDATSIQGEFSENSLAATSIKYIQDDIVWSGTYKKPCILSPEFS